MRLNQIKKMQKNHLGSLAEFFQIPQPNSAFNQYPFILVTFFFIILQRISTRQETNKVKRILFFVLI